MKADQIKASQVIEKVNELKKMVSEFIGEDVHIFDKIDATNLFNFESVCDDINLELNEFEDARDNDDDEENNIE
jgi:hypothetical protein